MPGVESARKKFLSASAALAVAYGWRAHLSRMKGPSTLSPPRHLLVTDFRTSEINGEVLIGTPTI